MLEVSFSKELPRISCIEVPGRIQGTGKSAVEALGGVEILAKSLGRSVELSNVSGCTGKGIQSGIFLRCNPKDRYSPFLSSTVQKRSDILVRYRRHRITGEIVDIKPVGVIVEKLSFDLMADFYCIPPEGPRTVEFDVDYELDEKRTDPIFTPPPVFTRIVTPFHYGFEDNPLYTTKHDGTMSKKRPIGGLAADIQEERQQDRNELRGRRSDSGCSQNAQALQQLDGGTALSKEMNERAQATGELSLKEADESPVPSAITSAPASSDDRHFGHGSGSDNSEPPILPAKVEDEGSENLEMERKLGWGKKDEAANAVCRYNSLRVPSAPPSGALNLCADPDLMTLYGNLFEMRPVWLRTLLDLNIPQTFSSWKRKPVFGRSCYLFTDGPWRGAYCRMGYDPRQDPESRKYQTIDFRDPYFRSVAWKLQPASKQHQSGSGTPRAADITVPAPSGLVGVVPKFSAESSISTRTANQLGVKTIPSQADDDIHFRVPPSRPSQLYQLCDIDDACVQQLLATTPPLEKCCRISGIRCCSFWWNFFLMKKNGCSITGEQLLRCVTILCLLGWLPRETMIKIRDLMLLASKRMRDGHHYVSRTEHTGD